MSISLSEMLSHREVEAEEMQVTQYSEAMKVSDLKPTDIGKVIEFSTLLKKGVPAEIGPVELRQMYFTSVEAVLYVQSVDDHAADIVEFSVNYSDDVRVVAE